MRAGFGARLVPRRSPQIRRGGLWKGWLRESPEKLLHAEPKAGGMSHHYPLV